MGRRGPTKTPSNVLAIRGSKHAKRRKREPKPAAAVACPDPPDWLTDPGREEWSHVAPELHRLGLIASIDHAALAAWCEAVGEFRWATEVIAREGLTRTTDKGSEIQHAAVGIRHRAWESMARYAQRFGFSPADRAGLVTSQKSESPLKEFLGGA